MHAARQFCADQRLLEQRRLHVGSRVSRTLSKYTSRALCGGDLRLRNIRKTLNSLGIIRSADQITFHEAFIQACLPHIYGEDWNSHSVRVLQEMNVKEIHYEVLCMTPRRWGKTWSVSIFVLALLVCVPGIRICVFSTGKRASGSLMQIVLDFLQKVPGGSERVMKQNQEELFISPPNSKAKSASSSASQVAEEGARVSKMYSFPSSVTGNNTPCTYVARRIAFHTRKNKRGKPPGKRSGLRRARSMQAAASL